MPPEHAHHGPSGIRAQVRRWRAHPVPVAAVLVTVALVALATPRLRAGPVGTGEVNVPVSSAPPDAAAPPDPTSGWVPLPAGVLTFSEGSPTAVWTGTEIIVLYAENADDQAGVSGYRTAPGGGRAAPIAASPLEWRARPATAWTGTEIIVAGGTGARGLRVPGAIYDPAADRWRPITPPPGFRRGASAYSVTGPAVWAGDRMVIWSAGLAYEPLVDRWDTFEPAPLSSRVNEAMAVTAAGILIWGGCDSSAEECAEEPGAWRDDGAWYDLASGHWTPLPPAPLAPGPVALAAAVGDAVHVVAAGTQAVYSPATGSWQARAALPAPVPVGSTLTATGTGLMLVGRRVALAYDPAADHWAALAGDAPTRHDHAAVWTGAEVVIAGGVPDGRPLAHRGRTRPPPPVSP
jgi:hypothetical protein